LPWKRADDTPEPTSYSPQPSSAPAASPSSSSTSSNSSTTRRANAVIGESIAIQGDLAGEEDLTILGRVQGKVDVKGNSVTIGPSGHVKADVYGKSIIVEGRVEGNLFGGEQIVLRSTGDVRGNLTAPRVSLEDGAQFKGAIDMEPKRSSSSSSSSSSASGSSASSPSGGSRPHGSGSSSSSSSSGSSGSSGSGASSGSSGSAGSAGQEKAAAKVGG
jgi:cytoskeletal protein CcmA (bactofilin family)